MEKKKAFILVFLLGINLIVFHVYSKRQPEGKEADDMFSFFNRSFEWQGQYAPDFEIEFIDGEKFVLSDHIGKKVIILNFFATWCGPCKEEMPELNAFYKKHGKEDFIMIGINDGEKTDKVEDFISDYEVRFPVGIDREGYVRKLYSVRGFPTTVFIDTDGKVQIYEVGPIMNADIAFDGHYMKAMDLLGKGNGITKEEYLEKLKGQQNQVSSDLGKGEDGEGIALEGRAKTIAESMYCPCGCSDLVIECGCNTSKNIKETLRTEDLSGKTDEEIIRALNKEFCVKGNKSKHDQG